MAWLGSGRMSSLIQQINILLWEFEREPGREQSGGKEKKKRENNKGKKPDFYAGWLKGGNEGGEKGLVSHCHGSLPAPCPFPDTSAHPLPTRVAAGGSEGDMPVLVLSGGQVRLHPAHITQDVKPCQGPQLAAGPGDLL